MNKFNFKSLLAVVLAVMMVFSIVPMFAVSAEETTYTKIDRIADLTAGTYKMAGYTDAYQVWNGKIANSKDCATSTYNYADGKLTAKATDDAADIELIAVEGKENTYYIKSGEKYLYSTAASNRKLNLTTTPTEWVASNNAKGGITLTTTAGTGKVNLGTNGTASSAYLRSYGDVNTLTYGVVFFAASTEGGTPDTPACTHTNTEVVGAKEATETEEGYTGDTVCKDCGETVATGEKIPVKTPETPVTPSIPLTNGMQVVIYVPGYNKALTSEKTGNYLKGVTVTVADGKVTGYGDSAVWTVIVNDDGTYSFENGGQKIGMQASYASMSMGSVNDKWQVIALGDGLYNIKNTVRGNYMEWYNQYSNWSTYNPSNVATDPQFQIAFFAVVEEETPACTHTNTEVVGAKEATETEEGYTGDTVCKDCGETVATGEKIPVKTPEACTHTNTEVVGAKEATETEEGYTGDTKCTDCGETIATGEKIPAKGTSTPDSNVVTAPKAGVPYKFGMVQKNVGKTFYLKGGMDGYYMATSDNYDDAIDVYLEETEGGYYLYTLVDGAKTYINMVVSGTHVNGAYEATASTVYTWDAEHGTLIADVDGKDYWFGTRNDKNYTTVGPCATSYNGFYCQFYPSNTVVEPVPTGDVVIVVIAAVLVAGAALTVISRKRRFN